MVEGWRFDDGMLPVNTAGSPGGGLQWPSDGDVGVATGGLVEKVLMMMGLRTTAGGLVVLLMMAADRVSLNSIESPALVIVKMLSPWKTMPPTLLYGASSASTA